MNCTANIPPKEKRKTPEPLHENPQDLLREKECPCSPAELLLFCLSLRSEMDPGQPLHVLPSRWSHPGSSVDPGKETGSGTSTGKAADGQVKNIPREQEHPYASG